MQDNKFIEIIKNMKDKTGDLTSLHQLIAGEMDDAVHRNFRREQAGDEGEKWKPLAKSTLQNRKTKRIKILQRRGAGGGLLGSIITTYNKDYAEIGTNLQYAAIHQFGGVINKAAKSETFIRKRWKKDKFNKKGDLIHKKGQFRRGTSGGKGFTFRAHSIIIPARPYIALTEKNHRIIVSEIARFIGGL
ncbi:MAG: phage virion morphogenesis protein [Ignavibacteriales bacterium]|nr:phage virion morphogenesis protein [Ignavibacteriaceae bacterium]MCZ2143577.1 phage virion morphogenesis protein [Ignavibacteriales bacterium]WKZ72101.1 MAG: phage virion morphogenesis protein [Ignavibacteriaceae bacterium]